MHIRALMAVGFMAAVLSVNVMGEDAKKDADAEKKQKLSDVVVTATKTTRSTESVSNSVTVIDEDEIKAKGHHSIADVLSGTPGIDIARSGGPGTLTSVFMRGADSKNVLLLIDGIPYNNPSAANRNAALSSLTTTNVKRIEIIRGPQSVLYGSNATAGVINVITKDGMGKPSVTYTTEAGSYDTYRNTLSSSGTVDRLSYSLSGDFLESQGFSVANRENDDLPADGNTSEKDGYRSQTYSGKLTYRFTDDFDVTLTGRHTESEVELDDYGPGYAGDEFNYVFPIFVPDLDGPYGREEHSDETVGRLDIHNVFKDDMFESNLYASYSEFKTQGFDDQGIKNYDSVGTVEQYGWQGNLNTTNNTFTIGADLYREFYKSEGNDIDENADTKSVWIQDQVEIDGFYLVAGARHDNHDRFGEHVTWRVAPAYTFESNTKIKASYGTGYRAPSLFELYIYNPSWFLEGNPNLEPEESTGWDIGIEQAIGDTATIGLTYFATQYDNFISFKANPWPQFSTYEQSEGDTDIQGVEFYSSWQATDYLGFLLNYTYTDTEADDGTRLVRRPLHKALLSTNVKFLEKAGGNLDIHYVGDRDTVGGTYGAKDQYGNSVDKLDAYVLVNLSLYYDVCKAFRVYGRIDNVTDEEYEHAWSYGTPGRSYYVGCRMTF